MKIPEAKYRLDQLVYVKAPRYSGHSALEYWEGKVIGIILEKTGLKYQIELNNLSQFKFKEYEIMDTEDEMFHDFRLRVNWLCDTDKEEE